MTHAHKFYGISKKILYVYLLFYGAAIEKAMTLQPRLHSLQ
jgi:hypothetical protein